MMLPRLGAALFLALTVVACGPAAPTAPADEPSTGGAAATVAPAEVAAEAPSAATTDGPADTAALPELRYYKISDG